MVPTPISEKAFSRGLLDVLIRAGLIAVLVVFCFQIFSPFLDLMLWSIILAITLYPSQVRFKGALGNKDGLSATLIVLIAICILMVPAYLLGTSIADSVERAISMVKSDSFHIPLRPTRWPAGHLWANPFMAYGHKLSPTCPTCYRSSYRKSKVSASPC